MKSLILIILIAASGVFATLFPKVSFEEKESMILDAVMRFLESYHFVPQTINDEYSEQTFDLYIDYIDGGKRFLTVPEIEILANYKTLIDDQIKERNMEFFDRSMEVLDAATDRAEVIYNKIKTENLDIYSEGKIEMESDNRNFPENEAALEDRWRSMMTYDLIGRIHDKIKAQKDSAEVKSIEELQEKAMESMVESYDGWFERIGKLRRSDRFETYINTITHMHDPHSDYFNPKEKQDFDIRMGGKLEGIGARLVPDGDFIKVKEIIPGGPAWKGKELEAEDILTMVRQDGEESAMDLFGMRLDDAVQKIRGKKGTIVFLTAKKPDGSSKVIRIVRDEVIIDESFAKSLILDIPGQVKNIGYINLPTFYDSFENNKGNSCAKDVATEIEKLNENNVNGIILDLRNNGGGSLRDVVTMSGLFIENGPIVQVKPRDKKAYIYSDKDKSVQYDGPVIVMVNQFSASASEILAAALQDYNRAVIVGSNSTFGKGTVQRFVNLDEAYKGDDAFKPLGNLKITMQKFYRINGGSTQLKGVIPDIILPNEYHYIDTGEKDYDHAMSWSEINPVNYSQDVYEVTNMDVLRSNSGSRVKASENYDLVLENAERLKQVREESIFPLNLDDYTSIMNLREIEAEKFDSLYDHKIDQLKISNLPQDEPTFTEEDGKMERNEKWIKNMNEDFELEETLYIMRDMISSHN